MDKNTKSLRNARFYWATLLCFHIGVAASCLLSVPFGLQSVWFCYVFVIIAAIAYYRYKSQKMKIFKR